jgi:ketosteroid isomerase-like protein
MSVDNVEIARATYEQFARGDFSAFEDWSDDFEFVTSPELPDAGTYRGEEARRWARNWVEAFEGLTMEATEIIDAGDKVVVGILQRGRFRGSQAMTEGRWWNVLTFHGEDVTRSELFPERGQALKAAGLSEYGQRVAIGPSQLFSEVAALDEKRGSHGKAHSVERYCVGDVRGERRACASRAGSPEATRPGQPG